LGGGGLFSSFFLLFRFAKIFSLGGVSSRFFSSLSRGKFRLCGGGGAPPPRGPPPPFDGDPPRVFFAEAQFWRKTHSQGQGERAGTEFWGGDLEYIIPLLRGDGFWGKKFGVFWLIVLVRALFFLGGFLGFSGGGFPVFRCIPGRVFFASRRGGGLLFSNFSGGIPSDRFFFFFCFPNFWNSNF